jgi:DNA repair ATPase RecN
LILFGFSSFAHGFKSLSPNHVRPGNGVVDADTHFLVEKEERRGATRSRGGVLVQAERIEEIARMLGGAEVTDKFSRAGRELIGRTHD